MQRICQFMLFIMLAVAVGCDTSMQADRTIEIEAPAELAAMSSAELTVTILRLADGSTPPANYRVDWVFTQNQSGATLQVINTVTNHAGRVAALYTAGPRAGIDIIQATGANGERVSATIRVQKEDYLEITAEPPGVPTGGSSVITVTRVVAANQPRHGYAVTLDFLQNDSGATLQALSTVTDQEGHFRAYYTAGQRSGTDIIRATGQLGEEVTVILTVTREDRLEMRAEPDTLMARATSRITVERIVPEGHPRHDFPVSFRFIINQSGATLRALSEVTDPQGLLTALYTAGGQGGVDILEAFGPSGERAVVIITVLPSPHSRLEITAAPDRVPTRGRSIITVTRSVSADAEQNLHNYPVSLTFLQNDTGAALSATNFITDHEGRLTALYTAGDREGTDILEATGQNGEKTAVIITVTKQDRIELTAQPPDVATGGTSVLTITRIAAAGQPVYNVQIDLSFVQNPSGATLQTTRVVTDQQGRATVLYTAGAQVGIDIIRATSPSGDTATVMITVTKQDRIELTAQPPDVAAGGTSVLTIVRIAAAGQPVHDVAVDLTFVQNASGASLQMTQVVTDQQGRATVLYTAGAQVGTDIIQATGPSGDTATVMITVTKQDRIELTAQPPDVAAGGTSVLTIVRIAAAGQPVHDVAVDLTFVQNASGASLQATRVVTDQQGRATVLYTAGRQAGTDIIRATAPSGDTATVMITVTREDRITITAVPATVNVLGSSAITVTRIAGPGQPLHDYAVTLELIQNESGATLRPLAAVTDQQGQLLAHYTAGPRVGTDIIRATGRLGDQASVIIAVTDDDASEVRFIVSSSANPVNSRERSTIDVLVTDIYNQPLIRHRVGFHLIQNQSGATLTLLQGLTDTHGRVSAQYQAGEGGGMDVIEIVSAGGGRTSYTMHVNYTGTTISATPANLQPRQASILEVRHTAVAQGASRQGYRFEIELVQNQSGATLQTPSLITDSNGRIRANYTAGPMTGADIVEARGANGEVARALITVSYAPGPAGLALAASTTLVLSRQHSLIEASLTNNLNQPVTGEPIQFTLVQNSSGARLDSLVPVTNDRGRATARYQAGLNGGTDIIQAADSFGNILSLPLTAVRQEDQIYLEMTADPRDLEYLEYSDIVLQATYHDKRPASGYRVVFSIDAPQNRGAVLTIVNSTTDARGEARAVYRAGTGSGTDVIRVTGEDGQTIAVSVMVADD